MRYKVTLPGPIFFSRAEDALPLIALAGPGATIEAVEDDPNAPAPISAPVFEPAKPAPVRNTGKKRGRPRKVAPEPTPVEPESASAPESDEQEKAPAQIKVTLDRADVQKMFAALIDVDYDAAASLLEDFGVPTFSALPDERLAEFAERLQAYS